MVLAAWAYYTFWIIVTPLIDADHPIQKLFIDRWTGLLFTTWWAYFALAFICTITGIALIRDKYQ